MTQGTPAPRAKGLVMHAEAPYYDLLAWLLTLGRERAFRERLVDLARLQPGDAVLDVGCGTGTLAIAAKRRVGAAGRVHGIDAAPEMIAIAKRKAAKAGVAADFDVATIEALPFPDASFDVVFSTLMLHHLPRPVREQCAREMRRVLRPGGRVLAADFASNGARRKGLLGALHRHGHFALADIIDLLRGVGLTVEESGSLGVGDVHFALATARGEQAGDAAAAPVPVSRTLEPLPAPRWAIPALFIAGVAAHALVLGATWSRFALSLIVVLAIAAVLIVLHIPLAGVIHAVLRRKRRRS